MAIVQEKREGSTRPEVQSTDYGKKTIIAATETPVQEVKEEPAAEEVKKEEVTPKAKDEKPVKKGRPKKDSK